MKEYFDIIRSQKTVNYFGLVLTVPNCTGYLATDSDGCVYFYSEMPCTEEGAWFIDYEYDPRFAIMLCVVELNNVDWKTTLKEVL